MKKQLTFKVPNALICDTALSFTARKVGVVIYAHRNALGCCHKSFEELADLAGCSVLTARRAVQALQEAGYLSSSRTYRYHKRLQRIVYGKRAYSCSLHYQGGYTLIPRSFIEETATVTPAAFCVMLYICQCAGNKRRAYPSITKICNALGVARSTVCRALHQIKQLSCILVQLCRKVNGCMTASSYHLVHVLAGVSVNAGSVQDTDTTRRDLRMRLHTFIVKAKNTICNAFSHWMVVPFLANYS